MCVYTYVCACVCDSKPIIINIASMCAILESLIIFLKFNKKPTMDNNDSYMLA